MEITATLNHLRERVRSGEPVTSDELEHIVSALDALETAVLELQSNVGETYGDDLAGEIQSLDNRISELES